MEQITIPAVPIDVLAPVLGEERFATFGELAAVAAGTLTGRAIINVNSTAVGGGVAEMLQSLLAYVRGVGVDIRWVTIDGSPEFFTVTKRIHNNLHGDPGDGLELGAAERATYDAVLATQAEEMLAIARPHDIVLLHDPQTLGLAPYLHGAGVSVVWRCHVGADAANACTELAWRFLTPYLSDVDTVVVSRPDYAPPGFPGDRVEVMPLSIDPLAVKNMPLTPDAVHRILSFTGLVQGPGDDERPVFLRRDGSTARVDRRADVLQLGPPPPLDAPLVVQVSRWDRLKDMAGVLKSYAAHVDSGAHLILAGPNVTGVTDDPEGAETYHECASLWRELPHARRQHVHLACLPTADVEENAVIVNALQRHATVVTQKSIAEGFGLTVMEAMWKGRPVVASKVGGIRDQIVDGVNGVLINDPRDLDAFGAAVRRLIENPELAIKIGAAAHERALEFLPDVHLARWASLTTAL